MPPDDPPSIVVATRNKHKLDEIRSILSRADINVLGLDTFPDAPMVDEDRRTLRGNAAKKAETIFAHTGMITLADDTGLEVDALDGRPGVYSARYAGPEADDADNRRRLLADLRAAENRTARFRTVMALAGPDGTSYYEGICEGTIIREERGTGGFGYDALFIPENHERTFAELSAYEKNRIGHRGRALGKLAASFGIEPARDVE